MSALGSETLRISVTGDITSTSTTLVPTVTRLEPRIDGNPVSVILAISSVFLLAPITISSNTIILAAFYRYKRLRTASNCLLASLAVSDFGVGIFMPFGMHLELSGLPENVEVSSVCIAPYCIVIALCSVSVLVTVAIAVDRLTSLAQPLRYKNIITHSSVEKYIAVFWLYAIAVGLSPLIYANVMGLTQSHSGSCRFNAAVHPPVQVFLVIAVWAPSALVLLGCYMYVYLVARAHARAIYTVELSFRHQTQTMALPRYGQTLAVTVGAFLLLWLPFQACMLLDVFCGTKILSEWAIVWLGLPILSHSALNPWIYAFHHGEMRVAATKIAEDVVTRFGLHPSRYGCSPIRRGSNANYELAEVNKNNNDPGRPPVEDCFAAKQHLTTFHPCEKPKCAAGEFISSATDISPEGIDCHGQFTLGSSSAEIVEEDIHDLTDMLKPEYAIDRNQLIDSNHNIDRMKHLKYLLDPTFNKIRNLKRFNQKRACARTLNLWDEPKFISYQNLKSSESSNDKTRRFNAVSDPTLNGDNGGTEAKELDERMCGDSLLPSRRNSNFSSMSDPNLKSTQGKLLARESSRVEDPAGFHRDYNHGYSAASLEHERWPMRATLQCRRINNLKKSDNPPGAVSLLRNFQLGDNCRNPKIRLGEGSEGLGERDRTGSFPKRQVTLTNNRLADLCNSDDRRLQRHLRFENRTNRGKENLRQCLTYSESINAIKKTAQGRLLEPSRFMRNLTVPTIHSEPPSPVESIPLDSLIEGQTLRIFSHSEKSASLSPTSRSSWEPSFAAKKVQRHFVRSPSRLSEPIIPYVLLNFDDPKNTEVEKQPESPAGYRESSTESKDIGCRFQPAGILEPEELASALLLSAETRSQERRPSGTIFAEHDSTRFSSRRPSDLRWSESSRSQEIVSAVNSHQKSPSSYSVNNFESCTSGSDLNDITCLGSFVCPDALTSSLRESFFEAASVINSEVFTSLDDFESPNVLSPTINDAGVASSSSMLPVHYSASSANLERSRLSVDGDCGDDIQSKSTESVVKNHHRAILRLEAAVHRSRPRVRATGECGFECLPCKRNSILAPLAAPTPMDICTPTYDTTGEIQGATGVGVRV